MSSAIVFDSLGFVALHCSVFCNYSIIICSWNRLVPVCFISTESLMSSHESHTLWRAPGLDSFPKVWTGSVSNASDIRAALRKKIFFFWLNAFTLQLPCVFFFLVFSFLLYAIKIVPKHWNLLSIASRKLCFTSGLKISKLIPVTLQCTSAVALTVRPIFHLSWRFHYSIKCIPVCPSGKKIFLPLYPGVCSCWGETQVLRRNNSHFAFNPNHSTAMFNKTVLLTTKTSVFLSFSSLLSTNQVCY